MLCQNCGSANPTSGCFVGRQREMEELVSGLQDVLSGQGRLILLAGEPGIGKTRTATELTSRAEAQGCRILWGRCYEGRGAPPYWPWAQPIRAYIQESDAEGVRAALGRGAAFISEIVADLRDHIPDSEALPPLDSDQARFRLFEAVTTFLKNAAQVQPLVVVLDDLHLADRSSLNLLEFIAREIEHSPVLVLGTYRDAEVTRRHPLSQTLGSLVRESFFHKVELRGLGPEDIHRYVELTTGEHPPAGLVEAMHARTEGNPLFISEFVRLLRQEGLQEGQGWKFRLPDGVRDAIGRHLSRLSEDCNYILRLASVIGKEFRLDVLRLIVEGASSSRFAGNVRAAPLIEDSEERLLEALEEALEAGIVTEIPESFEEYQFTHALIRETLLAELSASRQIRLHAQVGEALERLSASSADIPGAELAYHFARAISVTGPEKLVRYELLAGEQALAAYSYQEALGHFNNALAAKEEAVRQGTRDVSAKNLSQDADDELAAILYGLGHAQAALYQVEEAVANLTRAFDYYVESGDVQRIIAIAGYSHSVPFVRLLGGLISRAMEIVPPDSAQAGGVLANYGFFLGMCGEGFDAAYAPLERALSIAQREGDYALEVRVLSKIAEVMGEHLRWQQCIETCFEAIEQVNNRFDDKLARVRAHVWASGSSNVLGHPDISVYHAMEAIKHAQAMHDRFWQGISLVLLAAISFDTGNWGQAQALTDRGLAVAPEEVYLLSLRTVLEYEMGEFERGSVYLGSLVDEMQQLRSRSMSLHAGVLAIGAVYHITEGQIPGAEVARIVGERLLTSGRISPNVVLFIRTGLSLIAAEERDIETAKELYAALSPRAGLPSLSGEVSIDRVLGLLAQTLGRSDEAASHFEAALEFGRNSGYLPQLAWSCYDYARFLLERSASDDRGKALSLLHESLDIGEKLQMKPLIGRATASKENAETLHDRYPDDLTGREVEVLRLVASGMSNRLIGNKLFISLHTVNRHVSNIFAKTGSINRADAAAYAARHRLLSDDANVRQS